MRTRVFAAGLILAAAVSAACRGPAGEVMASLRSAGEPSRSSFPPSASCRRPSRPPSSSPPRAASAARPSAGWPRNSMVKSGDVVIRLASTELVELLRTEEAAVAKIDLEIAPEGEAAREGEVRPRGRDLGHLHPARARRRLRRPGRAHLPAEQDHRGRRRPQLPDRQGAHFYRKKGPAGRSQSPPSSSSCSPRPST